VNIGLSSGPDVEAGLELAIAHDVRLLEVASQHPAAWPSAWTPERARALRSRASDHGVELVVHSDSAVNVADRQPELRAAAERNLLGYVDLARSLGSDTVIVHGGLVFGEDLEPAYEAVVTTLAAVAGPAADAGITLVLENMNVVPGEIRYLGCTAQEVARILDSVDSPALAACADIGHAHLLPGGVPEFVAALGPRIGYAQLTDNDGTIDDHLALGDGTLDLAAVAASLSAVGARVGIAIELDDADDRRRSLPLARSAFS